MIDRLRVFLERLWHDCGRAADPLVPDHVECYSQAKPEDDE